MKDAQYLNINTVGLNMQAYLKVTTQLFPVWALLFSVIAYYQPTLFVDLKPAIIPLLVVIMLEIGRAHV